MDYDIAIIGAGCVGAFAAMYASEYAWRVLVVDAQAEPAMGTTNANSGIVHAGHNTAAGTLKARLVDRGNALIRDLSEKLNFGYRRCGELVVARTPEEVPALAEMKKYADSIRVRTELWDEAKIRAEEPNLSENIKAALCAPDAGVVNPYEMTVAALNTATHNGAVFRPNTKITAIRKTEQGYELQADGFRTTARVVVNAAGLYADEIAKMVDPASPISIRPRKGQEFLLDKDYKGLVKHVIFPLPTKVSKGTLIIPTVDGTIMVGPTAEDVDDKEDRATTADGLAKVFQQVSQLVPKINPGMIISNFAGCRAVDVSNDFVISEKDGFVNAAGIQSPGLTASPAIA